MHALLLLSLLAGWSTPARACLWDRDTLATELRGLPSVERVAVGDFERFPAPYYEARLARVTAELQQRPDELALYDDAGVAADRLGRSDEAIGWMARKVEAMARLGTPEDAEHRYRHHANLGTFLAHRWLRVRPADRADLDRAAAELRAALAIDPEAHFGRERVQLRAVEWLAAGPTVGEGYAVPSFVGLDSSRLSLENTDEHHATVQGLTGLIVLGAAWESIDVLYALQLALQHEGRNSAAALIGQRIRELVAGGGRSAVPDAPTGEALLETLQVDGMALEDRHLKRVQRAFAEGRERAVARHDARTAYLEAGLAAGRHPDTHAGFWDALDLPPPAAPGARRLPCGCSSGAAPGGIAGLLVVGFAARRRQVRSGHPLGGTAPPSATPGRSAGTAGR